MSEWGQQHGEGNKWQLNAKNFSKDFSKDKAAIEALNAYFQNIESFVGKSPPMNVEQSSLMITSFPKRSGPRSNGSALSCTLGIQEDLAACWIGIVPLQASNKILGDHVHD